MAIFNGKIHYNWPFSIAMLKYQRVDENGTSPWEDPLKMAPSIEAF